jgi:hypothetical protein
MTRRQCVLFIISLVLITCRTVYAGEQNDKTPPKSMKALFPNDISAALRGRWRIHFQPANKRLPGNVTGLSMTLAIPGKANDVVDQWIKRNQESIARYKKAGNRDTNRERFEKAIKNSESAIKELRARRAKRSPWGRFVQTVLNEPKKVFTIEIWYEKDMKPLQTGALRAALVAGGNAKIAFKEQAFQVLSIGDRSAYGITALTYVKSGKIRSYSHRSYVDVGNYRIQVKGYFKSRGSLDPDVKVLLGMTAARVMGIERFRIETTDGKPVVAHPKNACQLVLVARGFDGKPLAESPVTLVPAEPDFPFIGGKIKGVDAKGTFKGQTDANGRLPFQYIPPQVDKKRYPFLTEVRHQKRVAIFDYFGVTVPDGPGVVRVALDWPHPSIARFSGANGADAGLWTKPSNPMRVKILDADSGKFTFSVSGVGDFRLIEPKSAILADSASWPGKAEFLFLYRPPKMGLDVTKLPDLKAKILEANFKFALSYVDSVLKIPGMDKLVSKGGMTAVDIGTKTIESLKTAHATYELAGKAGGDSEPFDDQKAADYLKETTALLNDMVGLVDAFVGDGGFNPGVEAGKFVLANLNAVHDVHKQNWKVATSYEDLVLLPMRLTVTDAEGHSTVLMRKFGIKVNKELK